MRARPRSIAYFTVTALNALTCVVLSACGGGGGGGGGTTPTGDTTAPSVALTASATVLKAGATAVITFTFSETPSGFSASDIVTTNGALSGLEASSADPSIYTGIFSAGNSNGAASITVSGSYTDAAGNVGSVGASQSIEVDTLAPTTTVSTSSETLAPGASTTMTFTFSEDPGSSFSWDGSTGGVVVSGGSLGPVSGAGLVRTATFTAGSSNGTASVAVPAGAYADAVGNLGAAGASPSLTVNSGVSSSPSTSLGSSTTGSSTSGVGCALALSGRQLLTYAKLGTSAVSETLDYVSNWACGSSRTLSGNAVPNHDVTGGKFATKVSAQTISKTFTVSPTLSTTSTLQVPGYLLNSVKLEPGTAGKCDATATSVRNGCDYSGNTVYSNPSSMEVLQDPSVSASSWWDFGADASNAHVQPNGEYHYHGMPNLLIPNLNTNSANSMTLVGWAMDGFPIYADKGYATASDATSALRSMKGSYRLKTTGVRTAPSTSNFPLGMFVVDWEYQAGLGDLDECNGRTGVTPEFPNGIYHYYITQTYPFIQRCIKGSR